MIISYRVDWEDQRAPRIKSIRGMGGTGFDNCQQAIINYHTQEIVDHAESISDVARLTRSDIAIPKEDS